MRESKTAKLIICVERSNSSGRPLAYLALSADQTVQEPNGKRNQGGANWGVEHLDVVECITLSLVVKICRLVRSPSALKCPAGSRSCHAISVPEAAVG